MSFLDFGYGVPTDWPCWLSPKSALDTSLKLIACQGVLESLLIWTSGPCFMWEVKIKRHKPKQNPQNQNLLLMKIKRGWSAWMVMLTCSWFLWKDPLGFSRAALQQTGVSETKKMGLLTSARSSSAASQWREQQQGWGACGGPKGGTARQQWGHWERGKKRGSSQCPSF